MDNTGGHVVAGVQQVGDVHAINLFEKTGKAQAGFDGVDAAICQAQPVAVRGLEVLKMGHAGNCGWVQEIWLVRRLPAAGIANTEGNGGVSGHRQLPEKVGEILFNAPVQKEELIAEKDLHCTRSSVVSGMLPVAGLMSRT